MIKNQVDYHLIDGYYRRSIRVDYAIEVVCENLTILDRYDISEELDRWILMISTIDGYVLGNSHSPIKISSYCHDNGNISTLFTAVFQYRYLRNWFILRWIL